MSSLVDVVEETGNLSQVVKDLSEAVTSQRSNPAPAKSDAQPVDDSLPPKLRGKTREEIAEMYVNLESVNGRMANDLGAQRRLTDQFLELKRDRDLQSQQQVQPKPTPVKVDELLDRPTETLERFSKDREAALQRQLDQRLAAIEGNMARTAFVQKHADYEQIANDPGFVRWIQGSQYRSRAANAAYNGDWNAADELLTEYKSIRPSQPTQTPLQKAPAQSQQSNLDAARRASLESSSAATSASSSQPVGKIYKRADLMELRLRDPERYYDDGFQAEILRAYNEDRVK